MARQHTILRAALILATWVVAANGLRAATGPTVGFDTGSPSLVVGGGGVQATGTYSVDPKKYTVNSITLVAVPTRFC